MKIIIIIIQWCSGLKFPNPRIVKTNYRENVFFVLTDLPNSRFWHNSQCHSSWIYNVVFSAKRNSAGLREQCPERRNTWCKLSTQVFSWETNFYVRVPCRRLRRYTLVLFRLCLFEWIILEKIYFKRHGNSSRSLGTASPLSVVQYLQTQTSSNLHVTVLYSIVHTKTVHKKTT